MSGFNSNACKNKFYGSLMQMILIVEAMFINSSEIKEQSF